MAREDVRAFNTAKEIRKAEEAQQRFNNLAQQAVDIAKENQDIIRKQNSFEKELKDDQKYNRNYIIIIIIIDLENIIRTNLQKHSLFINLIQSMY